MRTDTIKHLAMMAMFILLIAGNGYASDEQLLFSNVPPNALIVLDLSGSMNLPAAGGIMCAASGTNCNNYDNGSTALHTPTGYPSPGVVTCPAAYPVQCSNLSWYDGTKYYSSSSNCADPIYASGSIPGGKTDCSKVGIAKASIFQLLDANQDGKITSGNTGSDDAIMNVTMGYMNFAGCDSAGNINNTWNGSGCITVPYTFGTSASPTKYSRFDCGSGSSTTPQYTCPLASGSPASTTVAGAAAEGGTPLAQSLTNALNYINSYASADTYSACRNNYVILMTDGSDTYACPNTPVNGDGTGSEDPSNDYPRRRATVAAAYALRQAGYNVFVIGFGALPAYQQNTLNWAAYFGGTQSSTTPAGSTTAIPTSALSSPCATTSSNDPGSASLSGYAFFASNPQQVASALTQAINTMKNGNYSFSVSSVSTARITSENNIYEASFSPVNRESLWQGHLRRYSINSDGSINYNPPTSGYSNDAAINLQGQTPGSWVMKTLIGNVTTNFDTSIASSYFAPSCSAVPCTELGGSCTADACKNMIVQYIQGTNPDNWKLGDIWHSNPVAITSPSAYFADSIDRSTTNAFSQFRSNHQRPSGGGRVVIAGANDGQFHVFETLNMTQQYSFVPPNLLPKLQAITHDKLPTNEKHAYYVDGPISAADVWLGPFGTQASKAATDWHTIAIVGEGRGVEDPATTASDYLWSSAPGCDSGFPSTASTWNSTTFSTYKYYCGYYAFDFTNMSGANYTPSYMWKINATAHLASDPLYLAEPWSKMAIGRVLIGGNEKWVGIIGGGAYSYTCSSATVPGPASPLPSTAGEGVFVIDLTNGNILWSYTSANNSGMAAVAAPPSIVDTDNDGFIDAAYVGDLAGNLWRFKFCANAQKNGDGTTCDYASWKGSMLYQHDSLNRPIYGGTSISRDPSNNLWIYWGSGDKQCPAPSLLQSPLTAYSASDRVYAIIDRDGATSYTSSNIKQITGSTTYNYATDILNNKNGWYYNLATNETMLSDPLVFGGITFFTTFSPSSATCGGAGNSTLYGFNYTTGAGALTGGSTTLSLGVGIPSSPLVSLNPFASDQANLYVTVSGSSYTNEITKLINFNPPMRSNRSNLIYWKDRRVQ